MLTNLLIGVLASLVRTYRPSNPPSRVLLPLREMSATLSRFWPLPCSLQPEVWEPFTGNGLPAADIVLAARKSEADVVLLSLSSRAQCRKCWRN